MSLYILPLSLFLLRLLLFSTTTVTTAAQPYKATDYILLNCGSTTSTTTSSENRVWASDAGSRFAPPTMASTSLSSTASDSDPTLTDQIPYSTARIFNTSSFTYTFPVSLGPKFLRLYFYPSTYSNLNKTQSFFSVSANAYSLLTNFSAFLHVQSVQTINQPAQTPFLIKEYIVHVKDSQIINLTFSPSTGSYAFINGIEIVSLPENLYTSDDSLKYVGQLSGPVVDNNTALEKIYRLNVGGSHVEVTQDTGMYRSWEQDQPYIWPSTALGKTPDGQDTQIHYTAETPNYTAPEIVYQTQRSMGNLSLTFNLTWIFPVDSGFYYMLRLHFCNIIKNYTKKGEVVFTILINNQTAEEEADLFFWTQGTGYPVFKDYIVFVKDPDGRKSKQDLWLAMHYNPQSNGYADAFLNGLEAFKLSKNDGSLAGSNPELILLPPPPVAVPSGKSRRKNKPPYAAIIGGVAGGLFLFSVLILVVFWQRRRRKHYGTVPDKSSLDQTFSETKSTKSCHSLLPSDRCRRFSLTEVKAATGEFDDIFVIGNGGFGKVYKGHLDNGTSTVAIKRLNPSSKQGFHEFQTEIVMLSKLRHIHLVSLIGYCDDEGEMILVYDYMAHGTLRDHLYRTNNPPLAWKRRLQICIGAAQGLHYLHTGSKRSIIHRDVKSTNILLDEKWVAKVSDFGLSKLGPKGLSQTHVSTVVKGSIGYVDPEYYRRQQLTDKSDVYSFGVVLFEVLCARPAMIPGLPKEQVSLAELAKNCYRKGTLHQIIDPKLKGQIAPECLRKFGEVADSCLREQGTERPDMSEVVWGLEFALQLQEAAEKVGGEAGSEDELPVLMQGEPTTTDDDVFSASPEKGLRFKSRGEVITTDDDVFSASTEKGLRFKSSGTSSMSSSNTNSGFKTETVFSEMMTPTGR